jgi:four helix bundle protein
MPTFRDLWIWKESHKLMLEIHQYVRTLPKEERFRKRDQIERSSSSVPDNISEGYTAYYYNEKIKGMLIARREVGETQNHIEALIGKNYLLRKQGDDWINHYERIIAGINGYVCYIRKKQERDSEKRGKAKHF